MGKCDSTKQELDRLKIQHREHLCVQVWNWDTRIYLNTLWSIITGETQNVYKTSIVNPEVKKTISLFWK
jgi:hypothetical protein